MSNDIIPKKTRDITPIEAALKDVLSNLHNIDNYEISKKNNKTTIKVDSNDGKERKIFSYEEQGESYSTYTQTHSKRTPMKERRELVSKLHSQGKSQSEIAAITMYSQKTISNDLQVIKNK